MSDQSSKLTTSDAELIEHARSGDTRAFGELWLRHYRSAARVARQFTSSIDADDLVSEAYARIYQRVLAGGGPTGAFRPYLYTTIRNLASTWGAASRDIQVDMIEQDFEDERIPEDPAEWALDRTLTARAFRELPERWQTVLWYTEVEGMDPHEVAPLMGMTANGVAALSYRAREGLRKAWLQAHVSDAAASGECQWAISRLGENARHSLTARDNERLTAHLADCAKCTIVSEEVDEVGSHLALIMLPLLLGGAAGGALLASFGSSSSAMAAGMAVPAIPSAVTATGAGGLAAPVVGGLSLGALSSSGALIGGFAVVAVILGGVAIGVSPTIAAAGDAPPAVVQQQDPSTGVVAQTADNVTSGDGVVGNVLSGDVTSDVAGVVNGVGDTVDGVIDTITDDTGAVVSADVALHLTGTGTPGATVVAQAAGNVYATVMVDASGHYVIDVAAFPGGLSSIELVQTVDHQYLENLALGQNPLARVLGLLDGLIASLTKPLGLSSGGGTVGVILTNH